MISEYPGRYSDKTIKEIFSFTKERDLTYSRLLKKAEGIDALLGYAIDNGDSKLIEFAINNSDCQVTYESIVKVTNYLIEQKNTRCKDIFARLFERVKNRDNDLLSYAINQKYYAPVKKYISSRGINIGNKELMLNIIRVHDNALSDGIVSAMLKRASELPNLPRLGTIKNSTFDQEVYSSYNNAVSSYNGDCDYLLSSSISTKNGYLAKKVLGLFKPLVDHTTLLFNTYTSRNDNPQKEAERIYKEAVQNGAFK